MEIVPMGDIMRQLVLALGAAMLLGSLAVVIREWRRVPDDDRPTPNWTVVGINLTVGVVLTLWGVGSLVAAS